MATQADIDRVEKVWQAFLANKGITDQTPIPLSEQAAFYSDWEVWLLNSASVAQPVPVPSGPGGRPLPVTNRPSRGPGAF